MSELISDTQLFIFDTQERVGCIKSKNSSLLHPTLYGLYEPGTLTPSSRPSSITQDSTAKRAFSLQFPFDASCQLPCIASIEHLIISART
jgi:hypothetical protein